MEIINNGKIDGRFLCLKLFFTKGRRKDIYRKAPFLFIINYGSTKGSKKGLSRIREIN